MRAEMQRGNAVQEKATPERCYILEVANDSGDEFVSIARARVESGITTVWHSLRGVSERYVIIAGRGRVELSGLEPFEVTEGDIVRIPAGTPQRITNTGDADLVFYCVCAPPFNKTCYEALE